MGLRKTLKWAGGGREASENENIAKPSRSPWCCVKFRRAVVITAAGPEPETMPFYQSLGLWSLDSQPRRQQGCLGGPAQQPACSPGHSHRGVSSLVRAPASPSLAALAVAPGSAITSGVNTQQMDLGHQAASRDVFLLQ